MPALGASAWSLQAGRPELFLMVAGAWHGRWLVLVVLPARDARSSLGAMPSAGMQRLGGHSGSLRWGRNKIEVGG